MTPICNPYTLYGNAMYTVSVSVDVRMSMSVSVHIIHNSTLAFAIIMKFENGRSDTTSACSNVIADSASKAGGGLGLNDSYHSHKVKKIPNV